MKTQKLTIAYTDYENSTDCPKIYQDLIARAIKIMKNAYAPYSKFKVGAAVLLDNDKIITGNNQENASFPMGSCAEKVAIHYAEAQYPTAKIIAIAIVAENEEGVVKTPISPCGSCRQLLLEATSRSNTPITVIMHGTSFTRIISDSRLLLPLSFDGSSL